ncbi:MAG: NAD(P)-dependent oxidoreductase [Dehalococcoidia bacterium]
MRVLITGGTGRWGPPVCAAFLREGFNVRLLLHRKRIKSLDAGTELVWGDVTQPDSVKKAMEGVDAVVHLAGIVQPFTEENPEMAYKVNVGGTQTVVDLIKERGGGIPFVFPSSVAVFGPCPEAGGLLLDGTPVNPVSVYAKTKIEAEDLIKESGIDYVILRVTAVPYLRLRLGDMKTHLFTIPLRNPVEFCHPDDASLAIVNAVKSFEQVKGNTLIIAGGPSQQILYEDMLRAVLGTFGLPLPPGHKFTEEPFPLHWYDTSRSQELLNFQQKTLDDFSRDLANQFPMPVIALMRHLVGPIFGRLIVRLM